MLDYVNLAIGVLSLALTIYFGYTGRKDAARLRAHIEARILDVLKRRLEIKVLTRGAQAIGIAENVTTVMGVPSLRAGDVARLLRQLALQYQEQPGTKYEERLRALERIRAEIQPKGPPLLSIAYLDRGLALHVFLFALFFACIALQLLSFVGVLRLPLGVVGIVIGIEILIAVVIILLSREQKNLLANAQNVSIG